MTGAKGDDSKEPMLQGNAVPSNKAPMVTKGSDQSPSKSNEQSIADSTDFHWAVIGLCFVSMIATSILLSPTTTVSPLLTNLLWSAFNFCQTCFTIEVLTQLFTFKLRRVCLGTIIDLLVTSATVMLSYRYSYGQSNNSSSNTNTIPSMKSALLIIHLLSLLRLFFRVLRLVFVSTDNSRTNQLLAEAAFSSKRIENTKLKRQLSLSKEQISSEKEHRRQVEKLLQDYKGQVQVLKEALHIAAQDVAQAAVAEKDGTDGEMDDNSRTESGGEVFVDEDGDEFYDGDKED